MEEIPPAQEAPVSNIRRSAESRPQSSESRPQSSTSRTMHGLPKRGARQAPIASVPDPDATPQATRTPQETGRASGRSLGAFQRGTLSGRNLDATSLEGSEDA